MLWQFAWLVAALSLIGCVSTPEPQTVSSVPTVKVPAPGPTKKCVEVADIPPKPATHMVKGNANIESNAAGAAADVHELVVYVEKVDPLIRNCAIAKE